jgi:L-alanine-DL-glutamate epimerase-like enolase superfamily enzyme
MPLKSLGRRDLLKLACALGLAPTLSLEAFAQGTRARITRVRLRRLRVEREVGTYPDWVGGSRASRVGGGTVTEIETDQGVSGMGPGVPEELLPAVSAILEGQDPFEFNRLGDGLMSLPGRGFRGPASAEIALWDLVGKLAGQPLYKLLGGGRDRVAPYSSMLSLGTPQERADKAAQLKDEGWQAIKYRCSFPTLEEDVQLVELTRRAVGDDWVVTADGNKAGMTYTSGRGIPWDFQRALSTAREYQRMNVYFLEEPLPRYEFAALTQLSSLVDMTIAGGEGNHGLAEFRALLEDGCYSLVQPEIMSEGPGLLHSTALLAHDMGKQCIPHVGDMRLGTICCLHLVASWPNAPFLEVFNEIPVGAYSYAFSVFENPPVLDSEGYLPVPQEPGLGVTIRPELFED